MAPSADHAASFGSFRLLPAQRLLLEADRPLRLGSRAFDILVALVEKAGELVTKEELIARVWPNTVVEDGNLRVHMAALRRALGDGQAGKRFVATIPGRGYRFVAPLSPLEAPQPGPSQAAGDEQKHNLPALQTRMVGRAEIVASLLAALSQWRLITLVGPGGIGKTTVALAVADELIATYRDGVCFVDLAPLAESARAECGRFRARPAEPLGESGTRLDILSRQQERSTRARLLRARNRGGRDVGGEGP
jgi:DNA-binding winged helix-turn-helix (wHTH) protein